MYVITRIWDTKPGQARRVATLAAQVAEIYEKAGQRSPVQISFNGGTLPGEINRVWMRWTAETIDSPYRGSNDLPTTGREFSVEMRELSIRNWIEFEELLSDDKRQD
jgi:hypothetical protein